MPSVAAAVDACVKACFVMNLNYSAGAKSSWLYIQKAMFDMKTLTDDAGSKELQLFVGLQTCRLVQSLCFKRD
jgi:hypothetical protein